MNNLNAEYNSVALLGGIRLFFCENKIIYLSIYKEEEKGSAVGFVKLTREGRRKCLKLSISGMRAWPDGNYPLYLITLTKELAWGSVLLKQGVAEEVRYLAETGAAVLQNHMQVEREDMCGLYIELQDDYKIGAYQKVSGRKHYSFEKGKKVHPFEDGGVYIML